MKHSILILSLITLCSISCKKETTADPVYPIEGYWAGKFGLSTTPPNSDIVAVIEPGGKIAIANGTSISSGLAGTGTWTLNGNIFKATINFTGFLTPYTYQATFSTQGKLESGTVGPGTTTTGYGTFFLNRKN
jgi:hypothetical protein